MVAIIIHEILKISGKTVKDENCQDNHEIWFIRWQNKS